MDSLIRDKEIKEYREENTPDECPILGIIGFKPVLDHDHDTGKVRGVLSNEANIWLGKVENYLRRCGSPLTKQEAIRRLSKYLLTHYRDRDQMPYHAEGLRQVVKRFKVKPAQEQKDILRKAGYSEETIKEAKNATKRANLYRKYLIE